VRILYFSRDYSSHDHRFLTSLSKAGEKVYYMTLERRGHVLEDRALPPDVEIVQWKGGKREARLSDGPGLVLDLQRVLRKIKPDIVQAGPIQTVGLIAALAGARPLLSMSWGYDLLIDAEKSDWWRRATEYTLAHSQAFLGDCQTIRKKAIAYGMNPDRIVTFPWGVDLSHFKPHFCKEERNEASKEPRFTLLSTRGWEPVYGTELIVRAFVRAAQKCEDLFLILLSNGSLAGKLRKMIIDSGMEERVVMPGQIGFRDLPRYYNAAGLYVSASHSDGTSISLLEALACGLPALVSDIPGNREWITDGEAGWTFPDGDVDALEQAILKVADTNMDEMRLRARALAEECGDWEKNFPKIYEAYRLARS
jgi:glycosyltransferase involved in cell wall biosynthesis